jgi:Na+/proline symporter
MSPAVTVSHATDGVTLAVFLVLFGAVTVIGFVAARWRRAALDNLDEWGLGGRRFGGVITWFLLGGDLYTAYTFIAVPALVFGVGAQGFFALPYTILIYPLVFAALPRLWTVAHRKGYVTPADFVRGRFGSRSLATAVAVTGLLATMPYIALQLLGIQVVLGAMGITGDWPLILAFAILAGYTYQSGLRAPALIAVVKDVLIYLTIIVAVIYIPGKLGGVWILQTLPSVALGLYTRLHRYALLAGWLAGMAVGTAMAIDQDFKSSVYPLDIFGLHINAYEALFALAANLIVAVAGTALLRALRVPDGSDDTRAEDYLERVPEPEAPLPATPEQEDRAGRFGRPARTGGTA